MKEIYGERLRMQQEEAEVANMLMGVLCIGFVMTVMCL